MTNITYTGCCIHVTSVDIDTTNNVITFTLSNGNTIDLDPITVNPNLNDKYLDSGIVSGTDLILTLNDGTNITVDVTTLLNNYLAGNLITLSNNTINVDDLTEVGSGISLINNATSHTLKTLVSSDNSIGIVDDGQRIDFTKNIFAQYDISISNTTTTFINQTSYFRVAPNLINTRIMLPNISLVQYGVEYHIFAASPIDILTVNGGNNIVPTITGPYDYSTTSLVNSITMPIDEYYTIRKYSSSAYIITKH